MPLVTGTQTGHCGILAPVAGRIGTRSLLAAALLLSDSVLTAQTLLICDGHTAPYTQVIQSLGVAPDTPDCSHPAFGAHITQALDSDLGKSVFVFNLHVTPDNDRCVMFDRQRLEIKTASS